MVKKISKQNNTALKIEDLLEKIQESIDNLTMEMKDIRSDITTIKLDIKFDLDRKVDKKHFLEIDRRMIKLEKK